MTEIVKETVSTQPVSTQSKGEPVVVSPVAVKISKTQTTERVIYFVMGILEVLLVFRLILKLMGASTASGFVRAIYGITGIFVLPFEGIFRKGISDGIETVSVLEPSTLVALIVYALIAWGVVQLVRILSRQEPLQ